MSDNAAKSKKVVVIEKRYEVGFETEENGDLFWEVIDAFYDWQEAQDCAVLNSPDGTYKDRS